MLRANSQWATAKEKLSFSVNVNTTLDFLKINSLARSLSKSQSVSVKDALRSIHIDRKRKFLWCFAFFVWYLSLSLPLSPMCMDPKISHCYETGFLNVNTYTCVRTHYTLNTGNKNTEIYMCDKIAAAQIHRVIVVIVMFVSHPRTSQKVGGRYDIRPHKFNSTAYLADCSAVWS